jgi:heme o synthase
VNHPRSGFAAPPQGGAACSLAEPVPRRLLGKASLVLGIFKLRIAVLIMVTALGGMAIAPGRPPGIVPTLALALSVLLA